MVKNSLVTKSVQNCRCDVLSIGRTFRLLSQAFYRCFQRIDKDKSRGNIMAEERELLREKAQELYHTARTRPGTGYEAFNTSLSKEKLYPLCGVERKSKPRGRPKRNA